MRSEYVFAAVKEINNRFLLCRVASASARHLHQGATQPSETINKSLKLIATPEPEKQAAVIE
jgi:DNA-directed RNA polymerase subunit K/omega